MGAAVVEGVEVRDCPHCRSKAHLKSDRQSATKGIAWFWVKCSNKSCGVSHVSQPSAEEAAAAWNARA
jgi:hypothetical protein